MVIYRGNWDPLGLTTKSELSLGCRATAEGPPPANHPGCPNEFVVGISVRRGLKTMGAPQGWESEYV